jgi:YHS domain-containing protein
MKTIKIIFSLVLVLFVSALRAQIAPIDEKGLAVGGYDVVAYFSNKATKGDAKVTAKHGEATYQFATTANRDAFKKNPIKYLPEFGGFCAWGVGAKSTKFPINPETFEIIDGKLYLFFNGPFNGSNFNSLEAWNQDQDNLLKAANANWPNVKGSK